MVNRRRRIIYHNDARHSHLHKLEPPLTLEQWFMPVDELLGTMVDTLVYSLGGGNIFLHDTKAGTLWGDLEEEQGGRVWNHLIWYRVSESVRQLIKEGYDPLRVVVERAHEKGVEFIVSLRMNTSLESTSLGTGRLDRFRRDHPEYQIGEFPEGAGPPSASHCLDFTYKEVRDERLAIIREVCELYPIDGFEMAMEYPAFSTFFKPNEAEAKQKIMTDFIRDVRRIVDEASDPNHQIVLAARIPPTIEGCRNIGLDVETWIREGLLDIVAPMSVEMRHDMLIDMNLPLEEWVKVSKETDCQVYGCISALVNDDRMVNPTVEMYRAAASNYWHTGVDGIYLLQFWSRGWPLTAEDYVVLREVGDPDVIRYKDKHYWVCTGPRDQTYFPYPRQLPVVLEEMPRGLGKTIRFKFSDDIASSVKMDILRQVKLRLRILNITPNDELSFKLNGDLLPEELCQRLDFTYKLRSPIGALERRLRGHYVFEFDLTHGPLPVKGWNKVTVNLERRDPKFGASGSKEIDVILHDVELLIRYRIARNYPTFEELMSLVSF